MRSGVAALAIVGIVCIVGCQSSRPGFSAIPTSSSLVKGAADTNSLVLAEGDTLRIVFPGAANLDTTQVIRRDGKITVDPAGEIDAAGLTPHALERAILAKLGSQLVVKEVSVTVQSSAFSIYVIGAVQRSGRIVADRRLTLLQAVIEAGIDNEKSDLKRVTILREHPEGHTLRFRVNLKAQLEGMPFTPFALQPMDIVQVPQRFSWF